MGIMQLLRRSTSASAAATAERPSIIGDLERAQLAERKARKAQAINSLINDELPKHISDILDEIRGHVIKIFNHGNPLECTVAHLPMNFAPLCGNASAEQVILEAVKGIEWSATSVKIATVWSYDDEPPNDVTVFVGFGSYVL